MPDTDIYESYVYIQMIRWIYAFTAAWLHVGVEFDIVLVSITTFFSDNAVHIAHIDQGNDPTHILSSIDVLLPH